MSVDRNAAKDDVSATNALHDFLQAFQVDGEKSIGANRVATEDAEIHHDWGSSHPIGPGHSAQEWREEWQAQRRPAVKEPKSRKTLWLGAALVVAVALSVFGVWRIDQVVHQGDIPADLMADHGVPVIHWGGQ